VKVAGNRIVIGLVLLRLAYSAGMLNVTSIGLGGGVLSLLSVLSGSSLQAVRARVKMARAIRAVL